MNSATDYRYSSFFSTARLERHAGRRAVVGALALGALAMTLGLVHASRTQPEHAVRTGALLPAPPSASLFSPKGLTALRRTVGLASLPTPPFAFIENRGQIDPLVGYSLQGQKTTLSFTSHGLTIAKGGTAIPMRPMVALDFVDGNPSVRPQGKDLTTTTIDRVIAHQHQGKTGLPTYPALHYREIWPGIDLIYTVFGGQLHATFFVKPGADPNRIQFACRGVTAVNRTEAAQLEVVTPVGSLVEETPVAYQESRYLAHLARLRNGMSEDTPVAYQERGRQRVEVAVAYTLERSGDTSVYGIHVTAYDSNAPLIIDRVIRYPGSVGWSASDVSPRLALDHAEAAYATGFPTPSDPLSHEGQPGADI